MDFRRVTNLFADPESIIGEEIIFDQAQPPEIIGGGDIIAEPREKYYVNPVDQFGSPLEIVKLFGGRMQYLKALAKLERDL